MNETTKTARITASLDLYVITCPSPACGHQFTMQAYLPGKGDDDHQWMHAARVSFCPYCGHDCRDEKPREEAAVLARLDSQRAVSVDEFCDRIQIILSKAAHEGRALVYGEFAALYRECCPVAAAPTTPPYYLTAVRPPTAEDANEHELVEWAQYGSSRWLTGTWVVTSKKPTNRPLWRPVDRPPSSPPSPPVSDDVAAAQTAWADRMIRRPNGASHEPHFYDGFHAGLSHARCEQEKREK